MRVSYEGSNSDSVGSPSGSVCFTTLMKASFSFVNVQVTVSPARREIGVTGLPSEHVADSRSQPAGPISLTSYVPGSRSPLVSVSPSERKKFAAQEGSNSNSVVSPSGSVCFTTLMKASFSFVNVQVPVSPAWREIAVTGLPSEHVADSRSQPAGTISLTSYVPGSRSPLVSVSPSEREKFAAPGGAGPHSVVSPSGSVCFTTLMKASFSFVNVQVTVSPAWREIEDGSEPSEHVALSRSQPAGTISLTSYVPGSRSPLVSVSPSGG